MSRIHELSEERYRNWDWNYGKSPKSTVQNFRRFEGVGTLDVRLEIEAGCMQSLKIYGDFFGAYDVTELEELLRGTRYEESSIRECLEGIDLRKYFGALKIDDFVALLLLA